MKRLASLQNPLVKSALALHRPGGRSRGEILVEGEKLVREALQSGAEVRTLFVTGEAAAAWTDQADRLAIVTPAVMRRLSQLECPPTALAVVIPPPAPDLERVLAAAATLVVLDRVQDPGNLGTILRTAEGFGAGGVLLLRGSCSPGNPKVTRAAMGSSFRVPVLTDLDGADLLPRLRRAGFACLATGVGGEDLRGFPFPPRVALFLGAEGTGLAPALREGCDHRLTIPAPGPVESFNVAIATAVCLYERLRQTPP